MHQLFWLLFCVLLVWWESHQFVLNKAIYCNPSKEKSSVEAQNVQRNKEEQVWQDK